MFVIYLFMSENDLARDVCVVVVYLRKKKMKNKIHQIQTQSVSVNFFKIQICNG